MDMQQTYVRLATMSLIPTSVADSRDRRRVSCMAIGTCGVNNAEEARETASGLWSTARWWLQLQTFISLASWPSEWVRLPLYTMQRIGGFPWRRSCWGMVLSMGGS
jgi:hypothetical protein